MRSQIRNFSIIAHIDHGKSTLADRLLECTGTIAARNMRAQVLDQMELERERGITIKMQPVRMRYNYKGKEFALNLIDTPGHIDFSYEVSRALSAVEGVLLVVDATQGVQAQTLTVLEHARALARTVLPVVNKIDLPSARVDAVVQEVCALLGCTSEEVLCVSGKTGEGVTELLQAIVERIPAPEPLLQGATGVRALVFDYEYSEHRGVIMFVRISDGTLRQGDELTLIAGKERFSALEVGTLHPGRVTSPALHCGEIGYVITGIKRSAGARVGDTVTLAAQPLPPLPGYQEPQPVVWASLYPESQKVARSRSGGDAFLLLGQALARLKLSDAALTFEEESAGALGRGYRCGFLGMLHLEIISERLRREFNLTLIVAQPTVSYQLRRKGGAEELVYAPAFFPDDHEVLEVREPWVSARIIMPAEHAGKVMALLHEHEASVGTTEDFGSGRIVLHAELPLRELMRGFFDTLKSATAGYASLSYEQSGYRSAEVQRLDILLNGERIPALSRVVSRRRVMREAATAAERLKELLPRQLIVIKIQASAAGRIIASETVGALRKDVTGYLYGGDITRKMKLLEKQKKGKKKMQGIGTVQVPHEVFLKMLRQGD